MATYNIITQTDASNKLFPFTFPYLKETDVKVGIQLSGETSYTTQSTSAYTFANATTISITSAPAASAKIKVFRDTANETLRSTFYPGSAIRSADLNDNYTQVHYVSQETEVTADEATTTATTAKTTADTAKATADDADDNATLALSNSRVSDGSGGWISAITKATTADGNATTASNNATNAVNTANAALPKAGGTMSGAIAMGSHKITGLDDPGADQDAATRKYVTDNFYTKDQADTAFFNVSTSDTIKDGDAFPDNDSTIATTAAINDRIIDLVDDVGGFWPIAYELAFPNANPDIDNNTGTIVSIKTLSTNYTSNGSGVISISNGTVGNSTVTITGAENSTTYSSGYGMLVETTTTLNTYTFHRLVPKATEVTTVAGKATEIGRLGTAAAVEDMGNLGTTDCVADMAILGTSAVVADLAILGTTDIVADMDALADISSNITTAASNIGNINAVAGQIVHAEDLGLITESLTSESGNNINTVADNINDINSFADQYKVASSTPGSPSAGDLWYDSSNTILKYYNGSAWQNISAGGILNLVEDTTPELGGNLDCNNKNLTEVATVSGDNLQIDFGTIA